MRMPQVIVDDREERKKKEEELQKKRDERSRAITDAMTQATIPQTVVHLKPKAEKLPLSKKHDD